MWKIKIQFDKSVSEGDSFIHGIFSPIMVIDEDLDLLILEEYPLKIGDILNKTEHTVFTEYGANIQHSLKEENDEYKIISIYATK